HRVEKLHLMFDIVGMSQIALRRIGLAEADDVRRQHSKLLAQRFHVLAKLQPSPGAWIGRMQHENVLAFTDFPIVGAIFTRLNKSFSYFGHLSYLLKKEKLECWSTGVLDYWFS